VDLLTITTSSLPTGAMGADYAATLAVQSPPGTPTWSLAGGTLPPGLALDAVSGALTGVLQASGTFTFTVRVDAGGRFGLRALALTVVSPDVSINDAANDLLAGAPLALALRRFLDFQGNHNGRYDVGDFRAHLRAQGHLPATMSARKDLP